MAMAPGSQTSLSQPPAEQSAHVVYLESHHHGGRDCNYPHFTGEETEAQVNLADWPKAALAGGEAGS